MSRSSYDDVPYPSHPMRQTHPDHLATVATLLGLEPPSLDRCRVLELGCASGGNLIPLALSLPDSTFVGIDLSREQVAEGQRVIDALQLQNIRLRSLSILDVDESLGSFDYILCHGVYSWVPPDVQRKILDIYQRQLAPDGIGYISYNTHPGWHLRGVVRHMMNFHVGRYPEDLPAARVEKARQLLDFLVRAAAGRDASYSSLLQEQAELLRQHSDAYLFHEHLEEHNEPLWFLDFCQRLGEYRLRYLAEAEFGMMLPGLSFPPEIARELEDVAPSLLEKEQYMDFVRNRSFRQSLVCHQHRRPTYQLQADRVERLWAASPVRPPASVDLADGVAVEFPSPDGLSLESTTPIVKAALGCLGEQWPGSLAFGPLWEHAVARCGAASGSPGGPADLPCRDEQRRLLAQALLTTFARSHGGLLRLSVTPSRLATKVSPLPRASPLARYHAERGLPITSLRHEIVSVTPFDRHLLPLLDGTRDHDRLLAGLLDRCRAGLLHVAQDDQPVTDPEHVRGILAEVLLQRLPELVRLALLLG